MLQVSPCPHPIWTASILMIRIRRQARLTALRASLLQAASVEGLRSISSRMCAICFTALAPHSTSAVRSLCSLIDQCRTHSRSRAVNQRGCSPLRTLFLIAPVFLSRRTLARRGRAAAPRSRKPTAHKAQACGLASSKHDKIVITVLKAQRRLKNKEREGSINATIHCSYFTHTHSHTLHYRVYFPSPPPNLPRVYSPLGVTTDLICYLAPVYLFGLLLAFSTLLPTGVYIFSRTARFERKVGEIP